MNKWKRQSGAVIELANTDNLNAYAKHAGWVKVKATRTAKANDGENGNAGKANTKRD